MLWWTAVGIDWEMEDRALCSYSSVNSDAFDREEEQSWAGLRNG
jgi:hypothetical protein